MKLPVVLVVKFDDKTEADAEALQQFNEYLEKLQWQNITGSTVWKAWFKEKFDIDEALRITKRQVKKAAAHAGMSSYEAVAHIAQRQPVEWKRP